MGPPWGGSTPPVATCCASSKARFPAPPTEDQDPPGQGHGGSTENQSPDSGHRFWNEMKFIGRRPSRDAPTSSSQKPGPCLLIPCPTKTQNAPPGKRARPRINKASPRLRPAVHPHWIPPRKTLCSKRGVSPLLMQQGPRASGRSSIPGQPAGGPPPSAAVEWPSLPCWCGGGLAREQQKLLATSSEGRQSMAQP